MKQKINHTNIVLIGFYILLYLPFAIHAQGFPDSFIAFRDTVYMQDKTLLETLRLYTAAKQDVENLYNRADLYLALARCEYLMGLAFRTEGRNSEAAAYFEQGIAWAENSLEVRPTSEGYRILGTNIAFLCEVRRSYGFKNYNKIEINAKKALDLNPHNLAANYLIAAQYVSAPWPLSNVRKGMLLLEEIIRQDYLTMEKEDLFNLYLMLEAGCTKQKKNEEAQIWHNRGAALYPTNNFINLLVK
jgi:tetratricopeptide (TPR) repeat protein